MSCRIIHAIRDFSDFFNCFYREYRQENRSDHAFPIQQTLDKINKERNTSMKKEEGLKYEQTVSAELEEEKIVVAPLSIFDVNQYLQYENDKQ